MSFKKFLVIALFISAMIAGALSFYASSNPDGLEKVAADHALDVNAKDSATSDSPFADYGFAAIDDPRLSGAVSGLVGIGVVGLAGAGLYFWMRKPEDS